MEGKLKPAIILSSHTSGLAVIRALGMMGVPIVVVIYEKSADMGYGSKYVSESIIAPDPEKYEDRYIDVLLKNAARLGGGLLIPTSDETVVAISRHKALLECHYPVACPDWKITEQCIEKKYTYAFADSIGVPAPKTTIPYSVEDVKRYSEITQYPCLVKPSNGASYHRKFMRKMTRVENLEQMISAYQEAADAGFETTLQELIPGDDSLGANYNSYFYNGEPLIEFTAQKIRNGPPGLGAPRVLVSKHIPEVLESGRKILQAMGFCGFSCIEFKKDIRDGVYKVMDVNARYNMSGLLALHCGINFPWINYKHLICGELPIPSDYRTGIYWIDDYRDIFYSLICFREEHYSISQYLKPYCNPHVFAFFDKRDPKPFILRGISLIQRAH